MGNGTTDIGLLYYIGLLYKLTEIIYQYTVYLTATLTTMRLMFLLY